MVENLRTIFQKAGLSQQEIHALRGVVGRGLEVLIVLVDWVSGGEFERGRWEAAGVLQEKARGVIDEYHCG